MAERSDHHLSRRERQIMDVIYEHGQASAQDVLAALPDPPSYSAVRALLRILEQKGQVKHRKNGARYIYLPIRSRHTASRSALKRVLRTFFDGSVEQAVSALLSGSDAKLSDHELDRLSELIDQARREDRQ